MQAVVRASVAAAAFVLACVAVPSAAHATGTAPASLTVSATGSVLNQSSNVMTASLTDQYGDPIRHARITITPYDDAGAQDPAGSCTATTDASGRASCAVRISLDKNAEFSAVAGSFAGDDEFAPASSYTGLTLVSGYTDASSDTGWTPLSGFGGRIERSGSGYDSAASGDRSTGQAQVTLTPGTASADASAPEYSTQLSGLTLHVVGAEAHTRATCVVSGGTAAEQVAQSFKVTEITLTGPALPGGSWTITPVPGQTNQSYGVQNYTLGELRIVVGETYRHTMTAVHVIGPLTSVWIATTTAGLEHCGLAG